MTDCGKTLTFTKVAQICKFSESCDGQRKFTALVVSKHWWTELEHLNVLLLAFQFRSVAICSLELLQFTVCINFQFHNITNIHCNTFSPPARPISWTPWLFSNVSCSMFCISFYHFSHLIVMSCVRLSWLLSFLPHIKSLHYVPIYLSIYFILCSVQAICS